MASELPATGEPEAVGSVSSTLASSAGLQSDIYTNLDLMSKFSAIRLLTILPGSGEETIRCRLKVATINVCTAYEALSYTWGNEPPSRTVLINGVPFGIRDNLYSAIEDLRLPNKRRRIWIDAICINQADLDERASQVKQMGDVYRNASQVLIWLGRSIEDMESIRRVTEHSNPWSKEMAMEALIRAWNAILQNTWFSRVWVVQELCRASGDPMILCGNLRLPWSTFVLLAKKSNMDPDQVTHILEMDEMRARARRPPRVRNFNNPSSRGTAALLQDDISWFQCTAMFEASDPRDKLYALLGLTRGPLGKSIEIDYTVSASSLMHKVMRYQVEEHQNLDLLTLCRAGHWQSLRGDERPRASWMPTLSGKGPECLPVVGLFPGDHMPSDTPWDCLTSDISEFRTGFVAGARACAIDHAKERLHARGCSLGQITSVTRDMNELGRSNSEDFDYYDSDSRTIDRRLLEEYERTLFEHLQPHLERLPTDKLSPQNIGWQLQLVCHHKNDISKDLEEMMVKMEQEWSQLETGKRENAKRIIRDAESKVESTLSLAGLYEDFLNHGIDCAIPHFHWGPLTSKLTRGETVSCGIADDIFQWRDDGRTLGIKYAPLAGNSPAMHGRNRFITDTGLLGIGPPEIRDGDRVVMLHSSSFAYALRDSGGGEQQLIGQVFVAAPYRLKDYPGEVWRACRPTNWPEDWRPLVEEEFVLK